jgi:hypothetical protein
LCSTPAEFRRIARKRLYPVELKGFSLRKSLAEKCDKQIRIVPPLF